MTDDPSEPLQIWRLRRLVMERLAHLIPRKQQEIERAIRLLRVHFVDHRRRAPKRGQLLQIMLIGSYASSGTRPDRETGEINHYEIWAFVDHEAYKGLNRYWGVARRAVAVALRGRAAINLSVFTSDEMERLRLAGNRFLTDQYDGGVVLYDHREDDALEAPHGER